MYYKLKVKHNSKSTVTIELLNKDFEGKPILFLREKEELTTTQIKLIFY